MYPKAEPGTPEFKRIYDEVYAEQMARSDDEYLRDRPDLQAAMAAGRDKAQARIDARADEFRPYKPHWFWHPVSGLAIGMLLAVLLLLSGCDAYKRDMAVSTGGGYEHCHDGVLYVEFAYGASVKYRPDGTIATCGRVGQ